MKRSELPYLDDLRAFEATARNGSVRAAANELSLTHAAVSRRVARVSETVGAKLFRKAGRGLVLTPAGESLRDACRRSFDDLLRTITSIRNAEGTLDHAVLLSCERSVAMRWLIPRLSRFQDAHPDVTVHLSVGGGAVEEHGNGAFLALRRLDFALDDGWTYQPLFPERVGPVMVDGMRASFEAGDYVALVTKTRPDAWDRWLVANPDAPRPRERRGMDHHFLMAEAACSGLGVGLSPYVIAADDVAGNRLVAPFGFSPDGSDYGLVHRAGAALPEEAQCLADWIRSICKPLGNRSD
ncbi:LysR family transcriptional regulator [Roseibium sp.]|uniref:LysR family transcriptional regulator n=1 Tax=Roseibium sp. TaxID=1936156 RepID=UPI003BAAC0B7